ncbi:MFS transporter [Amycolatopsis anabasis]|uniref:MFS transporter n=1 Tax=Amycolatopsis anabasis TaxID=1840409 RepID=UPI00131A7925|nr:MFS transporter [Amycolatopsis anabasis]
MSGLVTNAVEGAARPLSRNRDFHLLWAGQTGSELSSQMFVLTYPLLVMSLSGSPLAVSLVGFVLAAAQMTAGLPAGVLADRWDRKRILVLGSGARAIAFATLGVAVWLGFGSIWHVVLVALVEGIALAAVFPAEEAALPQVVPAGQLPDAIALNAARGSIGQVGGNGLGGLLFGIARALPFLGNALVQALSFLALLFVRIPARTAPARPREHTVGRFWPDLAAGLRWIGRQPVIRLITTCAVLLNLAFGALYIVFILLAQQRGVPAGQIGLMSAMFGGGGVLGALVSGRLHRALHPRVSIAGVFWAATALTPLLAFTTNVFLGGLLLGTVAFLAPLANTTIVTYQLLLTPDELRGRLSGAMGVFDGVGGALGPALGGLLLEFAGGRGALFCCAALLLAPALLTAFSPTLRRFSGAATE